MINFKKLLLNNFKVWISVCVTRWHEFIFCCSVPYLGVRWKKDEVISYSIDDDVKLSVAGKIYFPDSTHKSIQGLINFDYIDNYPHLHL